jgi:hypothetical protein
MAKAAKEEKKPAKKGDAKKLSPLEKARLAKKAGGKPGKKKASKKKALPVFKAPEEFKPFFFRALAKIGKDGFINDIKLVRIKGSLKNENAKTVDMADWDPLTLQRFGIRYGTGTFVTNPEKRLPAGQVLKFAGRVSVKSSTGGLGVSLKEFKIMDPATKKAKDIDSKSADPYVKYYRLARKPAKFLAGAFTNVKPFPSGAELKAISKEKDSESEVKVKSKKKAKK